MKLIGILLVVLAGVGSMRAQPACYRTMAEAAAQAGIPEGAGFHLVSVRRDALSGRLWATLRRCGHPEWPAVMVPGNEPPVDDGPVPPATVPSAGLKTGPDTTPDVLGGVRVRVLQVDGMARMEMTGVTQSSGRVGGSVWVRILAPGGDGEGRMQQGVVRTAELIEIGQ